MFRHHVLNKYTHVLKLQTFALEGDGEVALDWCAGNSNFSVVSLLAF